MTRTFPTKTAVDTTETLTTKSGRPTRRRRKPDTFSFELPACRRRKPNVLKTPNVLNTANVIELIRANKWDQVNSCVREDSRILMMPLLMDNSIQTTILHEAIASKGNTQARATVILTILEMAPIAASIQNGRVRPTTPVTSL